MKRFIVAGVALAALAAVALTSSGCYRVKLEPGEGARKVETKSVPVGGVKKMRTTIEMALGELELSAEASSTNVMDGEFTYTEPYGKPEITYSMAGEEGVLFVRQPRTSTGGTLRDGEIRWDVKVGGGVPTALDVLLGVGRSKVDLRGLDVTDLKVLCGVGETALDLSGARPGDLHAKIETGVGATDIRLPKNVGVKVTGTKAGLGDVSADGFTMRGDALVNDAWDGPGPKIEIDLVRGVGGVTLELVD